MKNEDSMMTFYIKIEAAILLFVLIGVVCVTRQTCTECISKIVDTNLNAKDCSYNLNKIENECDGSCKKERQWPYQYMYETILTTIHLNTDACADTFPPKITGLCEFIFWGCPDAFPVHKRFQCLFLEKPVCPVPLTTMPTPSIETPCICLPEMDVPLTKSPEPTSSTENLDRDCSVDSSSQNSAFSSGEVVGTFIGGVIVGGAIVLVFLVILHRTRRGIFSSKRSNDGEMLDGNNSQDIRSVDMSAARSGATENTVDTGRTYDTILERVCAISDAMDNEDTRDLSYSNLDQQKSDGTIPVVPEHEYMTIDSQSKNVASHNGKDSIKPYDDATQSFADERENASTITDLSTGNNIRNGRKNLFAEKESCSENSSENHVDTNIDHDYFVLEKEN